MPLVDAAMAGWIRLVRHTARWSFEGMEHRAAALASDRPAIVAFWHERVGLGPLLWAMPDQQGRAPPPGARCSAIISRHRDGMRIARVAARFGVAQVAGSARRGAVAAARGAMAALAEGSNLAITPDGPRGPRRVAKPGLARMAAQARCAVLPAAIACRPRLRFNSWDRFHFPLPFGRAAMVYLPPIEIPVDADDATLAAFDSQIALAMTEAAARADALIGAAPTP